jgi:prepilin-type N-terminal cleavage/methylation domain-containing protein
VQFRVGMDCHTSTPFDGTRGYSLLELIVVLSIVALAAAIALPDLQIFSGAGRPGHAAREMLLTMRMARWKALSSGRGTRLAIYGREAGESARYVVEREEGSGWVAEGRAHLLPAGIEVRTTGPARKVFYPNGTCSLGSVIFTGPGGARYRLSLNPATGRVRLYRGEEEVGNES